MDLLVLSAKLLTSSLGFCTLKKNSLALTRSIMKQVDFLTDLIYL